MFCTNCGKKYDGNACPTCGTPAGYKSAAKKSAQPVIEEPSPVIAEMNQDSQKVASLLRESINLQKKRRIKRIIKIVITALLLIVIAVLLVMFAAKNISSADRLVFLLMFDKESPVPSGYKVYTDDEDSVFICGTVNDSLYLALVSMYSTDANVASSWKTTVEQAVNLSVGADKFAQSKNYNNIIYVCIKPYSALDDYILIVCDGKITHNIIDKIK